MTIKKAERVTGCRIEMASERGVEVRAYDADGQIIGIGYAPRSLKKALQSCVESVLRHNQQLALDKYDHRCRYCGRRNNLEFHHKTYRSHQGTHAVDNLEVACAECHDKAHKRRLNAN